MRLTIHRIRGLCLQQPTWFQRSSSLPLSKATCQREKDVILHTAQKSRVCDSFHPARRILNECKFVSYCNTNRVRSQGRVLHSKQIECENDFVTYKTNQMRASRLFKFLILIGSVCHVTKYGRVCWSCLVVWSVPSVMSCVSRYVRT